MSEAESTAGPAVSLWRAAQKTTGHAFLGFALGIVTVPQMAKFTRMQQKSYKTSDSLLTRATEAGTFVTEVLREAMLAIPAAAQLGWQGDVQAASAALTALSVSYANIDFELDEFCKGLAGAGTRRELARGL